MKSHYDFSKAKRGRVVAEPPPEPGKVRITIRLDEDLVDYFLDLSGHSGGRTGYQTRSTPRSGSTSKGRRLRGKRRCGGLSGRRSTGRRRHESFSS